MTGRRKRKPVKRNRRASAPRRDTIDELVASTAQALGLTLDPAWLPTIAFNLRVIMRHAALIDEIELPDDAEPAPVFHA
jgi:hypothetical protein